MIERDAGGPRPRLAEPLQSLRDATFRLRGLSLYDLRSATQAERDDFVTVCHALIAEIEH